MPEELKARIRRHRREHPERASLAGRLLASIAVIEREFSGEPRERLLRLASQTFDRHLRLVETSKQARESLAQLEANQQRLVELVEFLGAEPPSRLIH